MPTEINPTTPLSLAIYTRMKQLPLSSKQLAVEVGVVYETIRGILKGDRPPSKLLLQAICRVLSLNFEAMDEMRITEQVKRKFDRVPALRKNDPELQSIEEAWPLLLPDEKEHIILLVEKYVRKQKEHFLASAPRILPRAVRKP